jgi:hypothetical protein
LTSSTDPTSLGTVGILDSVRFYLYDTTTHLYQSFDRAIKKASNKFEIIWQPSSSGNVVNNSKLLNMPNTSPTQIDGVSYSSLSSTWILNQNYPNSFQGNTYINFYVQQPAIVDLKIYNLQSMLLSTLINHQKLPMGLHQIIFSCNTAF